MAAQLVLNGVSTDATSTLFPLPFTAFDVACCMGKEAVCGMLLEAQPGADWWKASLDLATNQASAVAEYVQDQEKHTRCVQLLKRCKALAGLMFKLCHAETLYDADAVAEIAEIKLLLLSREKRSEGLYVLLRWCCAVEDDDTLARMALEAGADPNRAFEHGPPLHVACRNDCPRIAKLLLDAHADPNAMVTNAPREGGTSVLKRTALDLAMVGASTRIIQILLDAGVDFNAVRVCDGKTFDAKQVHRAQS